ncbi:hypothetical protein BZ163_15370 [Pseudomonas sp. VI4.1]|nr:hypothetical protein BZ163_15370 [Pseudomonas sp. VI4.1]
MLAERFGVSRTVIREAISRLKSAGLVEVRQGGGTVISEGAHIKAFTIDLDVCGSIEAVLRVTISKATGNPLYPSQHEFIAQFIKEAIRIIVSCTPGSCFCHVAPCLKR